MNFTKLYLFMKFFIFYNLSKDYKVNIGELLGIINYLK